MHAETATDRLTYSQYISFAGKPLLVRSNSIAILSHVVSFFSPWTGAVPEDPAAELRLMRREDCGDPVESSSWFRGRDYFAMARFTHADTVWFNLHTRRACGLFSDDIVSDEFRWHKDILPVIIGILAPVIDVVPVHAACLAKNGSGVLLAGPSGVGKSTLTVTLARLGYSLLADDWTYLAETEDSIGAWSLPVPVKLLPDAICYFPEIASYSCGESLNGEIAYEVSPQKCFNLSREDRCGIRHIVLLERRQQPGISIVPVTATETISHFCSEIEPLIGPLAAVHRGQIELLQELATAVCLRASFNASPQDVASAIDHALGEGAQSVPGDGERIAAQDSAQPTDMMHRRTPLALKAKYEWSETTVCIETNHPEILRAARDLGFSRVHDSVSDIDLHLQFELEEAREESHDAPQLRVLRDGRTAYIEIGQQGWFAFDAETANGTGFLAVAESGAVEAYFAAVIAVVKPLVRRPMKQAVFS